MCVEMRKLRSAFSRRDRRPHEAAVAPLKGAPDYHEGQSDGTLPYRNAALNEPGETAVRKERKL